MSPGADIDLVHGVVARRSMDREQAFGSALTFAVHRSPFNVRRSVWRLAKVG
jgi:hypothetical protein